MLDYIAIDRRSSGRLLAGHIAELPGHRSDHRLAGQTLVPLRWSLPEAKANDFRTVLAIAMDSWTTHHTMTDITETVQAAVTLGKGRPRLQLARHSAFESCLHDAVRTAATDADRRNARRELQASKDAINRDERQAQTEFILQNIGGGGWGKTDMSPKLRDMPYLGERDNKIYKRTSIATRATRHYRHMFEEVPEVEPLDGAFAVGERTLAETLARPQEDFEIAMTADIVAASFWDCPKGKTANGTWFRLRLGPRR